MVVVRVSLLFLQNAQRRRRVKVEACAQEKRPDEASRPNVIEAQYKPEVDSTYVEAVYKRYYSILFIGRSVGHV
jgi:hypothetical protein